MLVETFEQLRMGCDICLVPDALHAIECLSRKDMWSSAMHPTLILVDLYLPRLSGHEFLIEIRRRPEFENVLVALWTGLCSPQAIEAAYEYGAQMCLTKPHSLQGWVQLAESLAGIMAQPRCNMSTPARNRPASRLSSPGGYLRHCLEVCSQTTE